MSRSNGVKQSRRVETRVPSAPRVPYEQVESLLQPDTIAEFQFIETLHKKTALDPEKKLMLALLEDGIKSFQGHLGARTEAGRRLFDEAEAWILARDGDWVFSFESVCEALGFSAAYVRHGLLRWKEQRLFARARKRLQKVA